MYEREYLGIFWLDTIFKIKYDFWGPSWSFWRPCWPFFKIMILSCGLLFEYIGPNFSIILLIFTWAFFTFVPTHSKNQDFSRALFIKITTIFYFFTCFIKDQPFRFSRALYFLLSAYWTFLPSQSAPSPTHSLLFTL